MFSLGLHTHTVSTGDWLIPPVSATANQTACCPNRDVQDMNRHLYFGGMDAFFLIPSAVSFAMLTVIMLIAGAGLVVNTAQGSMWPGNGWGYSCGSMLSLIYALRFYGVVNKPCPDTMPGSAVLGYGFIFSVLSGMFLFMILVDGMMHSLDHMLRVNSTQHTFC